MQTKQEIFDKVATHLLTQKVRSYDSITEYCAYRGDNGLKCAVGALIPDSEYFTELEVGDVGILYKKFPDLMAKLGLNGLDIEFFLNGLQYLHDYHSPEIWHDSLTKLAKEHRLNTKVLEQFQ